MTLDATPGGASADSYLTVAAADTLAAADLGPEPAAWLALANATPADLAKKEAALKRATREIDGYLRAFYPETTAVLMFPREVDVDDDDEPFIPRSVVLATYQQAIHLIKNVGAIAAANTRRARNLQSASEPDTSYSQGDAGAASALSALALHYADRMRTTTRGISSVKLVAVEPE